ncbi:UNVERIFIED_CONTAM: hypothetical protein FKN15_064660 [Acipenser sinensis]
MITSNWGLSNFTKGKGFLAKNLQAEALSKLDQRLKVAAEQFMKILEQMDAMSFPENVSDCRMKKKGLVKTVQGFLAKNLQAEALSKLDQRLKVAAEQFMKILEQMDAMSFPENFSDCRMKKKGLVKTVQACLAQCDKIETGISDHLAKLQSKNLSE